MITVQETLDDIRASIDLVVDDLCGQAEDINQIEHAFKEVDKALQFLAAQNASLAADLDALILSVQFMQNEDSKKWWRFWER